VGLPMNYFPTNCISLHSGGSLLLKGASLND